MATMKNILPVALIVVLLSVVAVAAISQFAFNNTGTVATMEVIGFQDEKLSFPLDVYPLTWEPILPGGSDTKIIYVKNTGNVPAIITLDDTLINPAGEDTFYTLTWLLDNETAIDEIAPEEILVVVLTLTINIAVPETITSFTFTAIINAEEAA
jgi:hypothetical protein